MLDVTIIGAGPAGSAAAILLARRGVNVTLIEQHRFPRDKVCGECVSALGVEVLDRLEMLSPLLAAGAISLRSAKIHGPGGDSITMPLPRPMLGISRSVLDSIMLEAARNAGANILQSARCEAMDVADRKTVLRVRDLGSNGVEELSASLVIVADGKSVLPGASPPATGDIGIKSHWTGVEGPRDAIELFGCAGCYGGLAAIENNRWNTAFSVPAARLRTHRGDIEALFAELMTENPKLYRRLSRATRIAPWLASPLPRFSVRKHWPIGVVPIGNAVAALEPIGGEGMGLALRSAEFATEAVTSAADRWDATDARRLRAQYRRLWRIRITACRMTARVISSTNLLNVAIDWMKCNERLGVIAMKSMGKAVGPVAWAACP